MFDAAGQVVIRHRLRRGHVLGTFQKLPPCLVGTEACASSLLSFSLIHTALEQQVVPPGGRTRAFYSPRSPEHNHMTIAILTAS